MKRNLSSKKCRFFFLWNIFFRIILCLRNIVFLRFSSLHLHLLECLIIFLLIIALARERRLGSRRSRLILMNRSTIACVWQWRLLRIAASFARFAGIHKSLQKRRLPTRDASRILPRAEAEKVHLLSGPNGVPT